MRLDEQIAQRFSCPKCKHRGAKVKRISTTGTGFSKLFDIQHNKFIVVSCQYCGFTEFYNPEFIEGKSHLGSILDFILGS